MHLHEITENRLSSFERLGHQHAFCKAVIALSEAWVSLLPDTTRAGRHALASAIEQHLEDISEQAPQEELDLLGGSFRRRREP